MGGLVIDIVIEFLFRSLVRLVRAQRTKSWPVATAEVTGTHYRPGGFGCTVLKITYQFEFGGKRYASVDAKPFLWTSSAKEYSEQHSAGSELLVRVKPGKPEFSIVRDNDIYVHAHGYGLETK
ncbi:MAG: DUF3592 domain-containing protein [Candidatus Sulfotelmatobacter sp.]